LFIGAVKNTGLFETTRLNEDKINVVRIFIKSVEYTDATQPKVFIVRVRNEWFVFSILTMLG